MRAKVAIYIEGGGDTRALQTPLKRGFKKLFEKAVVNIHELDVIPCGGRDRAYKDFRIAFEQGRYEVAMLLIDSEGPVATGQRAWQYFSSGVRPDDVGFTPPTGSTNDNAHLMVQMMEAWFITDVAAFRTLYRHGLQEKSFSNSMNLEQIPKHQLIPALENATRQTSKGQFKKSHGAELIAELNVAQLRQRSAHADRLFTILQQHLGARP